MSAQAWGNGDRFPMGLDFAFELRETDTFKILDDVRNYALKKMQEFDERVANVHILAFIKFDKRLYWLF